MGSTISLSSRHLKNASREAQHFLRSLVWMTFGSFAFSDENQAILTIIVATPPHDLSNLHMLVLLGRKSRVYTGDSGSIDTIDFNGKNFRQVATVRGQPDGLAIKGKRIYWTNMGTCTNKSTAAYFDKDGTIDCFDVSTGKNVPVLEQGIVTPKQLALNDDWLYFGDREGMAIRRVRTDGSHLQTLYSSGDYATEEKLDATRHCVGCYVHDGHIYFSQKGPPKGGKGKLLRMKITGEDVEVLIDNLPEPIDITFGAKSGKIYWTDRGGGPDGNSLNRGEVKDGKIVNHEVLFTGFNEAIGVALTDDESLAFVTDLLGDVHRCDLNARTDTVIYKGCILTGIEIVGEDFFN